MWKGGFEVNRFRDLRVLWGVLLVVGGVLFLLQNLGYLRGFLSLLWALIAVAASAALLYVFLTHRDQWWAIIPGCALLGLAGAITLDGLLPAVGRTWSGPLFLGATALGFLVLYVTDSERWWALIPGGVLLTLALVSFLSSIFRGLETGGIFFLGLGLTFGLVSLAPTPRGRQQWALIPGAVLLVVGVVITIASMPLIRYLWPLVLILIGLYLVWRFFRFQRRR
jgi:hypothetical protein